MKLNILKLICVLLGILPDALVSAQVNNPKHLSYSWATDTSKRTVNLSDITLATQRDEIPTLDHPKFIKQSDPLNHYYKHEPVIVIQAGGRAKAYPLSILTLYELSNDSLDGKELMITFCPTCNAAIVFNRELSVNGKKRLLQFGISGLLMHNDMVMYDKQTQTWWEQLMGSAVVGELAGTNLELTPALLISVKDYFDRFPDGDILSPEGITLVDRKEHRPFYHLEHGHRGLDSTYYLPEKVDPRLPPLERVLDIHEYGHNVIYPFHVLSRKKVVNDIFERTNFVIFYHGDMVSVQDTDNLKRAKHVGSATAFQRVLGKDTFSFKKQGDYFVDDQTHSTWDITGYCRDGVHKGKQLYILPHSNHFAFAYLAFHPDAIIHEED